MLRDVAHSTGWVERISHVVRGPGWGAAGTPAPVGATPATA